MSTTITEFLLQPDNLEIALAVEKDLRGVRRKIFIDFWTEVRSAIKTSLRNDKLLNSWRVFSNFEDQIDGYSHIAITSINDPCREAKNNWPQLFAVTLESLAGPDSRAIYGICRWKEILPKNVDISETELVNDLKSRGFLTCKWWSGYKRIGPAIGSTSIDIRDNRSVMSLFDDVRTSKSVVHSISAMTYDLFKSQREILEIKQHLFCKFGNPFGGLFQDTVR